MGGGGYPPNVLMTIETNPEVLAICYTQGWCSNEEYMTFEEGSAVQDIGTIFMNKTAITHFEEFEHFTGVTSLSSNAFDGCSNLGTLVLPNTIASIGSYALRCAVPHLVIPNSVQTLGDSVCNNRSTLLTLVIGNSVTSIGAWSFYNCSNLQSITFLGATPPALYAHVFTNTTCPIYVPEESVSAYKSASGWGNYASRIHAIP